MSDTLSGDESLELPEFDAPPQDPLPLLKRWLDLAAERGVREPLAVVLSTVDASGRPAGRVVLLKEVADGALVFTSHTGSRKGCHLQARPYAAMTFYWRETLQQLCVSGPVELLPDEQSSALFAERPLAAQATTVVSRQSQPLTDERALHEQAEALIAAGQVLARPEGWAGYRLVPQRVEFWQGRASRLHRRLEYTMQDGRWIHRRLQP